MVYPDCPYWPLTESQGVEQSQSLIRSRCYKSGGNGKDV